jgi:hypothetical protein
MVLPRDNEFKQTRDFIQDVTKVIGKAQQVFLPKDPNDWHRGLLVAKNGICTQQLNNHAPIELNLRNGEITFNSVTLPLKSTSAQHIFTEITRSISKEIEQPELVTSSPKFNNAAAFNILKILNYANESLSEFKTHIKTGVTSPVLLYPHHFDISLVWYPKRSHPAQMEQKHQLTFGLSTGDDTISEPYFYITSYPNGEQLKNKNFPTHAYWNKKDFTAAILPYSQAHEANEVIKFFILALN